MLSVMGEETKLKVVKRDGSREEFSEKKIAKVAEASGLTEEKARALAQKVAIEIRNLKMKEVASKKVREYVTQELKKADPYAFGLYVWYERTKDRDGKA